VVDFAPAKAEALAAAILRHPGLAYEAHSTDYQTEAALRALVEAHFAILKVGPGLTFALREAVSALAAIEAEWVPAERRSRVREALEAAMLRNPGYWRPYYPGTPEEQRFARAYSLSDRARYYWPDPAVRTAVDALVRNLTERPAPLPLLSQYLPDQYTRVRRGTLAADPRALVLDRVRDVLRGYARACNPTAEELSR
jgi:D-tagatose-1,6-bisphosphate aldolase subunit GatZ/KbaZ